MHAIELLKTLAGEDERDKAAVYMEGLAQMRRSGHRSRQEEEKEHERIAAPLPSACLGIGAPAAHRGRRAPAGTTCRALRLRCSPNAARSPAPASPPEAVAAYQQLTDAGRGAFFSKLVDHFAADPAEVNLAIEAYQRRAVAARAARSPCGGGAAPPGALPALNIAPGGTRTLVQMRARSAARRSTTHPERAAIDADLVHLFRSWFNRGFLVLQRIDWRTSALVLERLIRTKRSIRSRDGTICAGGSRAIAAATRSSIRRCRTSR